MSQLPTISRWLSEPLPSDVALSIERIATADDVQRIAVMPDVHLSGDVCVGLVVATRRLIYPAAVGGDIGCGMAAVAVDAAADLLAEEGSAARLLAGLCRAAPAMRHSKATLPTELPVILQAVSLSDPRLSRLVERDGRVQFGTLGRGNHFLEFQHDQEDRLWIMLHSGSRAMGQAISSHHVAIAERLSGRRRLPFLDAETAEGAGYLADAEWAVRYAEESRLAMLRAVEQVLQRLFAVGLEWSTLIHANHNHVGGNVTLASCCLCIGKERCPRLKVLWASFLVPWGALAFTSLAEVVRQPLCSSSHGAGRALSRADAARSISTRQLSREMQGVWFDVRQAEQLRDEAPSAYKDIRAVMRAQRELTRIDRQLEPVLSYKGA